MEVGSADFPNSRAGMSSPLAKALFKIDGKFTYSLLTSDTAFCTYTNSTELQVSSHDNRFCQGI